MFTFSNYSPIGLDISDLSLKLVQLYKRGEKIKIQAIGKINIEEGIIKDGEILDKKKLIEKIDDLINHPAYGKVNTNEVSACLPETMTFIKLIKIPKTTNLLSEIIEGEMEKHIPMAISDVYYDWEIIKDRIDIQEVLIGVAPRNIVDQYISVLNEANLFTNALEIEPVSICRALLANENPKSQSDGNYGIIDIGAKRTSLTVYSKNTILFTLSMPISGEKITKNIAEILKIDENQAEKAKIICGLDENKAQGIIKTILTEMIDKLTYKIGDAIDYYENHFPDRGPIDQILLCGGGANIKNLAEIINKSISIEVKRGNALANLKEDQENFSKIMSETHKVAADLIKDRENKKTISVTQDNSLTYTTAIGLALRGIFGTDI